TDRCVYFGLTYRCSNMLELQFSVISLILVVVFVFFVSICKISFIYPDSEGQDVVMNIHKKQGGTFNDITPNQMSY
ncbi:unnamed protein product, partial [Brassica oleracea]